MKLKLQLQKLLEPAIREKTVAVKTLQLTKVKKENMVSTTTSIMLNNIDELSLFEKEAKEEKEEHSMEIVIATPSQEKRLRDMDSYFEEKDTIISDSQLTDLQKKTVRKCLRFLTDLEMNSGCQNFAFQLCITKNFECMTHFSLLNKSLEFCTLDILKKVTQIRVADFAPKNCLKLYLKENIIENDQIQFQVDGRTELDRAKLAYLKGLLNRKDEIAVVPIPDTGKQLLLFDLGNEGSEFDGIFNTKLNAILVNKYNLVLDLDETLVRTKTSSSIKDKPNKFSDESAEEYEFNVNNMKYICFVRPGTKELLAWGCQIFNIMIVTNSIWVYAKEIIQILDPNREHLLKGIDLNDNNQLNKILKTRKDMVPHPKIPKPLGQKDLLKFNLSPFETVILDDDASIWKLKEPILPFDKIVENKGSKEFFFAVRAETWNKLSHMICLKWKLKHEINLEKNNTTEVKEERPSKRAKLILPDHSITFSQELCMENIK
jgi:hypothetical protein